MRRALLALLLAGPAAAADRLVVRVWHTNDVHGWIMARPEKDRPEKSVGGAAALAALVKADPAPKLFLDAGDWWQGTPEGSLSKGEAVADVFNALGYDAVEIGNHEFDAGAANLEKLVGRLKAPVLAANLYGADGRRVPWARPRLIKEVAGVKFGIFGLLTSHLDKLAFPKNIAGLKVRRELDEAREQVAALKAEGADVIVAVTHVGWEEDGKPSFEGDQTLAREVPGIALIVGGHSHTFLRKPFRDPKNGTLIVQAGSFLVAVGRTTLELDPKTKRVLDASDELVPLDPAKGSDADVAAVVARKTAAVDKAFEVVLATAAASLDRNPGERETPLGDWVADCYRAWAKADLALQNGGGIRSDLPAGPVTLRRVFNIMPFDNTMVKLKMKGSVVRRLLDHGVGVGRVVQESGAEIVFKRPAPRGERLVSVALAGGPLDDGKIYSVAALDFMTSGGDGYDEFAEAEQEPTGVLARDVLRDCAARQKTITPPAPGRLKVLEN